MMQCSDLYILFHSRPFHLPPDPVHPTFTTDVSPPPLIGSHLVYGRDIIGRTICGFSLIQIYMADNLLFPGSAFHNLPIFPLGGIALIRKDLASEP